MRISVSSKGDFSKLDRYMNGLKEAARLKILDKYGKRGVAALSSATPIDTGLASTSWYYEASQGPSGASLTFYNSDVENGFPVAIMLQYGHGTGTGGWVEGIDYINPALKPIFDQIVDELWREVTSL